MRHRNGLLLGLMAIVGCSESPSEPGSVGCADVALTLEVQQGSSLVLDWEPTCGVALLLIEPVGGSDAWQIRSVEWDDDAVAPSSTWNTIEPPVTYGVTPSGAEAQDYIGPDPLIPGDYTFTVFRFLNEGVSATGVPFTFN